MGRKALAFSVYIERVEFEVVQDETGPAAQNVTKLEP